MYKIKTVQNYIAGIAILFGACSANASLVQFTLEGSVDPSGAEYPSGGESGNIFNVVNNEIVFATGSYESDDITINQGIGNVSLSDIVLNIGDLTFDLTTENYTTNISFDSSGALIGLNYGSDAALEASPVNFDSFDLTFTGSNTSNTEKYKGTYVTYNIAGHWDANTYAVVPVPAAAWLFGSGLIGLVGLARRKAA